MKEHVELEVFTGDPLNAEPANAVSSEVGYPVNTALGVKTREQTIRAVLEVNDVLGPSLGDYGGFRLCSVDEP